jgi:selenocysteine lyase/cysteine desulfurase
MNQHPRSIRRRDVLALPPVAAALGGLQSPATLARPSGVGVWERSGRPRTAALPPGGVPDAAYWRLVRSHFLIEEGLTYLNTGTCGLQTRETAALERRIRDEMALNFNRYFVTRLIDRGFREVAGRVAAFVGADLDGISFTSGATEAMNYIANGLDLSPGDEVLTTSHDHQAGLYPWRLLARRRGVVVRQLDWPSPPASATAIVDLFAQAMTPRTRVLSFCHVQYTDGSVLPVRDLCELARRHGAISVVDGAQSVGMLPVAMRDLGCDFFATSLHKWLGAPYGTGLMWVRADWRDRLWPTVVESYDGWDAEDRYGRVTGGSGLDFVEHWPATMIKHSTNVHYYGAAFWATAPAVAFQEEVGPARIAQRARQLASRLRDGLTQLRGVTVVTPDAEGLSAGLLAFKVAGADAKTLSRAISRDDRLVVRSVVHDGIGFEVLRACLHLYNTEEDVDRLVAAVAKRLA